MPNVKLAIRVRPFTERELRSERDRVTIVNVIDDKTVTITNLKVSASGAGDSRERVRRYHADYTFNSACAQNLPEYASQETVFESVGRDVMSSLSRLSSVCVLAYGQSATGKTHTMMGTDAQPGLVPRLCRALAATSCDVTVSFLEIYNERVHDLLVCEDAPAPLAFNSLPRRRGNARKDLRVREHPTRGPYVQNLRRVAVSSVEALLALVSEGARRRRTAATRRNLTSSRSHALLEISTPQATLHLADLAGSENASWEGCCGGRQKEGANINKSLVALSNVISALVSSGRGRFVPYRDSALTWLLKDCFTGGACTFIIATVSPSVACYGESASTLRWSARARQLPPPRSAPPARAAQAHYHNLLAELSRHYIRYIPETGKIFYEDCHWDLQSKHGNQLDEEREEEAKIGNLMNMLQPKTDNFEPTASPHVGSDASDIASTADDKSEHIVSEIKNEVDKLLCPTLERTRSGSELEIVAPLRHKRRQYRSQEVLPIEKTLHDPSPRQSRDQIHKKYVTTNNPKVAILYDNQRAEIVASVTERLYSKLKKKEEAAVSKVESMVDRKIMEPLNELKICTNARQRLMELSQKALRNKRRIGIPAHTQTRKTVTRVKDQGIDVQTDLESYFVKDVSSHIICRDASTETMPMTPRCKDIAVGPKYGSLHSDHKSTGTDINKVLLKSVFMMTEDPLTLNRHTQTRIVPPPRRKKSMISRKYNQPKKVDEYSGSPIISINISQRYMESESQSSDDNLEVTIQKNSEKNNDVGMTPDLLTNHSNVELVLKDKEEEFVVQVDETHGNHLKVLNVLENISNTSSNVPEDFPEPENCSLPRVSVNCSSKGNQNEFKDIILGRNENVYPYNIVLSPPREKDDTKRIVKFKDSLTSLETNIANTKTYTELNKNENFDFGHNSEVTNSEKDYHGNTTSQAGTSSDSLESGQVDSDSFVWHRGGIHNNKTCNVKNTRYTPVYKSSSKYRTAKSKLYRDFLRLDEESIDERIGRFSEAGKSDNTNHYSSSESTQADHPQSRSLQSKQFFENQYKKYNTHDYEQLEKQILDSCNTLDLSADKYDRYLDHYHRNSAGFLLNRTPKKYLQHLVQLRKEVIKADSDTTDSPTY